MLHPVCRVLLYMAMLLKIEFCVLLKIVTISFLQRGLYVTINRFSLIVFIIVMNIH